MALMLFNGCYRQSYKGKYIYVVPNCTLDLYLQWLMHVIDVH